MTISGIQAKNSHDQLTQDIELIHKTDAMDLVIPQGQDPLPKSDKTKVGNNMKGVFGHSYIEKVALQTVYFGLGLYALWSNRNLLGDGINALRKGASSISTQANAIGLYDQKIGGEFVRNPFFSQTIDENSEQKSFYDELFSATHDGAEDGNIFSQMQTQAVKELVEQSFYDNLMISDLRIATELENKINTWILEQKNLAALREIDELKDDIDWLENEINSLHEDIHDYQQQIQELTKQGLETRSKFTDALNQFDQFHRRIERVCDVLLKIPIVKRIGAVKGFCNASDDVRDILNSSRNYLEQTQRRRLDASEEANKKYVDNWPPLNEKSHLINTLKLLKDYGIDLLPLDEGELNNFYRLHNVTSVININEERASTEATVYFQELENHLNHFTQTALNNFTNQLTHNSTSDENLSEKLDELLSLQSQVHANIESVINNIDEVEKKWGNAGMYLALAASALVYVGMSVAHISRLCTADRKVARLLDNPFLNPQHMFTLTLGRAFQKVFSYNLIYRQEALKESLEVSDIDDDIEAEKLNRMRESDGEKNGDSKKLKKLSAKAKSWIFAKHLIEGTLDTIFSAGFFFVVAGRVLDNILQNNRDDIRKSTNETNSKLEQNGTKAVQLIGEIRDIAKRKQAETEELREKMSQTHSEIKLFNDQTLPDEISRFTQELLNDPSNTFSPEFEEMISSPEFTELLITAYKPDDEFTNTLNAFDKFNKKLSTQEYFPSSNNTNEISPAATNYDHFEKIESHYLNSNRSIDEPTLPNDHSFGVRSDIAVIATVLAIRVIGGYVMETRDLNKSLDKDMVSTRQRPFEWLTSWFTEQKPFVSGVTDIGLHGKFLSRKYGISDPFSFFLSPYNAHKKNDDDASLTSEESKL